MKLPKLKLQSKETIAPRWLCMAGGFFMAASWTQAALSGFTAGLSLWLLVPVSVLFCVASYWLPE